MRTVWRIPIDGGSAAKLTDYPTVCPVVSPDGQWIYLFTPGKDKFTSVRLVNTKHHNYKLEPNVHFSPDGKWVIFRANFEGHTDVYAVEIAERK